VLVTDPPPPTVPSGLPEVPPAVVDHWVPSLKTKTQVADVPARFVNQYDCTTSEVVPVALSCRRQSAKMRARFGILLFSDVLLFSDPSASKFPRYSGDWRA